MVLGLGDAALTEPRRVSPVLHPPYREEPMETPSETRYLFTADAVAIGGYITHPFCDVIESQASAVLPNSGGYGTAKVGKFQFRDLISFDSATSTVSGSELEQRGSTILHTLSTVVVEGLNVANVVTADAIVARVVSRFDRETRRHEVHPIGSTFVNLRIAGTRIEPTPRKGSFASSEVPHRASAEVSARDPGPAAARGQRAPSCLFDVHGDLEGPDQEAKIPPGCDRRGDAGIRVPGFGTIFLGEYIESRDGAQLSMLRIEMGCPVRGTVSTNFVRGGGSDYP